MCVSLQCELYPLIDDTVQTYKSMAATGVACEVIVDDQVPSKVFVDPVRLKQILSNALTNSLKHTDSGTVTVQAHIVPIPIPGAASTKPEDYILFQVIDTGDGLQGMDPKRLFDPTETFGTVCVPVCYACVL